jgi:hypothetical protein
MFSSAVARADDSNAGRPIQNGIFLAYARSNQLEMLVGQYNPKTQRWYPNTHAFKPPAVRAVFTLFGVSAKLATVYLSDRFKEPNDTVPWDWSAHITPWDQSQIHVALALSGVWPDTPHHPELVPTNDPDLVAATVAFLKEKHLDVPAPRITQAMRVDLNGDGHPITVFCANNDLAAMNDQDAASIYNLALARFQVEGKPITLPLRVRTSYKPANRTVDDHWRYEGAPAYFQILAFTDIEQNGQEQISILNDDRSNGPEIDLCSISGNKVIHTLKARKVYF